MGCTNSKQSRKKLRRPSAGISRTQSLRLNSDLDEFHDRKHDHIVTLMSSTLGSLDLQRNSGEVTEQIKKCTDEAPVDAPKTTDISAAIRRAKAWSETIGKIIPRTPTETPPNEPENINCYELMAGLEGYTPPQSRSPTEFERHSFSFYTRTETWPEVVTNGFTFLSPEQKTSFSGIVKAQVNAFQERIEEKRKSNDSSITNSLQSNKCPSNSQAKLVLYFTSLRGIRKTFEECCEVRNILKSYQVRLDERDVSMDRGFRDEVKEILGNVFLPAVFVNGQYLGGLEEIKRLHDEGAMKDAIEDCEKTRPETIGDGGRACERCGDVRFVLCATCSGSCRVYIDEYSEFDEVSEENECGFRQCRECNENGIVRCPVCTS